MSVQLNEPGLTRQICMKALAIAIPIVGGDVELDILSYEDIKTLRLTSKRLQEIANCFITDLRIHGANRDFEVLTASFLKNLHLIDIIPSEDFIIKCIEGFKKHTDDITRVLKLAAPTLQELSMHRLTMPASKLLGGTGCWPNLKRFSLCGNFGNLVGIKQEFLSMRKLHTLSIMEQELNKEDADVLLLAFFLSNLTELTLSTADAVGNTEYMSKLLAKASNLNTLVLHGEVDFDYLGSAPLNEKLKKFKFDNYYECDVIVHFGPLLSQPRPHLRSFAVKCGRLTTENLEKLMDSATENLPNLEQLMITDLAFDEYEELDWSLLSRLELPNLVELRLDTYATEAVFITESTVKLPKLKTLDLGRIEALGRDKKVAYEKLFSSPLLHQLTTLRIPYDSFDLDDLAILCKHAQKFENLEKLTVHSRTMKGVEKIATCGKRKGGFPRLQKIDFSEMAIFANGRAKTPFNEDRVGDCLRKVWPNIEYECHYSGPGFGYTPVDEFGWHPPRDYWGDE